MALSLNKAVAFYIHKSCTPFVISLSIPSSDTLCSFDFTARVGREGLTAPCLESGGSLGCNSVAKWLRWWTGPSIRKNSVHTLRHFPDVLAWLYGRTSGCTQIQRCYIHQMILFDGDSWVTIQLSPILLLTQWCYVNKQINKASSSWCQSLLLMVSKFNVWIKWSHYTFF